MLKHCEMGGTLDDLEEWFRQNSQLPEEIDRRLLRRFLKCMHGDVDEAKKLIELNYELRNRHPRIFIDRDPEDESTQATLQATDLVPLPGLTPDGNKILFLRLHDHDPGKMNSVEECKIFFMVADCRFTMVDEEALEKGESGRGGALAGGDVQIVDLAGYTVGHVARISFLTLRTYMRYLQEAYPVRLRAMHIINCPAYLDKMVAVVKPFISDEVYKMIHFHMDVLESLYEQVPKDMLPDEYGGRAGKMADLQASWRRILKEKRKYLMDARQWKVEQAATRSRWLF